MTHTVIHRALGIELNLSEPDLGCPDRPGLLEELHHNYRPELLYCLEAHEAGEKICPGFMTICMREGRPYARHVSKGERRETAVESELHRALKEYTASAAEREGLSVTVEERAAHGKRRSDVVIQGDGLRLGYEIQLAAITPGSVDTRTKIARDDGLRPLWLVNDVNAMPIDRAPWARLEVRSWKDIRRRDALAVRGGVKTLTRQRCDWRYPTPCPVRRHGRCGQHHGMWEPTRGLHYDDMVRRTASGDLVPLYMPRTGGGRGWHMWVTPADKAAYLQDHPEPVPPGPGSAAQVRPLRPRARDPRCHYGEDSGVRDELVQDRDSGMALAATLWEDELLPQMPKQVAVGKWRLPGELFSLQRAVTANLELCAEFAATLPLAREIVAGRAEISRGQMQQLRAARGACLDAITELHQHPWWHTVSNRFEARMVLRRAARQASGVAA